MNLINQIILIILKKLSYLINQIMLQIINPSPEKSIREKELEEGYKLFNERHLNIKNKINNKVYSDKEIKLIMLALDDWVSRIKLSRQNNNW